MRPDETGVQTIYKTVEGTEKIFGNDWEFHIEAEIDIVVNTWHPQGVGGRMEDAVEGDVEVLVTHVEMFVHLYPKEATLNHIQYSSTCMDTFDKYFEVEACDAE